MKLQKKISEKIKVLMVGKFYPPEYVGGIEYSMYDLAMGLTKRGVEVDVIVTSNSDKTVTEDIEGVTVHRVRRIAKISEQPISLTYPFVMRKLLRQNNYDVVHLHFPYPGAELSCLFNRLRAKLVVTYHMDATFVMMVKKLYKPFMHACLRKADKILVSSDKLLRGAKHLSKYRDKSLVVPLFVKDDWFDSPSRKAVEDLKTKYGSYIFYAGRLFKTKGVNYFLQAVRNLDCNVVIAGAGPEFNSLKALVNELGIEGRVFFVGSLEKVRLKEFYYAAEVFCLPSISREESFGLVLIEAMAADVPVISTELGTGTTYINKHDETGLVVKPGDVNMLEDAVKRLMSDKELRIRMGKAAKKRAEQVFSEHVVVKRMMEVYRS
jgi:rhamnosyl/mannosyltransferase